MTITLEILKNDETNLAAQISQLQGALIYNRRQQEFVQKRQEEQKPEGENPPVEPDVPIR